MNGSKQEVTRQTQSNVSSKIMGKQISNALPASKTNYKGNLNTLIAVSGLVSNVLVIRMRHTPGMHYVARVLEKAP
jgi:hypothetical protein